MAKRIITISREFGSGGRFIGEELAKKLGLAYYDKNIINEIAEKSGLSPEYIQESAELSPKKGLFAYAFAGRDITGKSVEDMVYEAQRKVILELADKESCVIIGRNADYILKEDEKLVRIFLYAPLEYRLNKVMEIYHDSHEDALRYIHKSDHSRKSYYEVISNKIWGDKSNYDLCLYCKLGNETIKDIICNYVKSLNK